ncbi:MAG TPA: ATP-dependent zinc metalloprotease FtsH [Acidobacteriota bacterium]|nr:ATP-dependent zinc metalloprotease FtsH [Acidobacteriota bacterium]HNT16911.1 ATP-dependent zinc metalloprotease FtsH [Acidobacteriota bacterium]HPA27510.1 ATP-dependent zinc metalloprotease FtsH [Acidobacteriota bacterium]HQO20697.1 ATP-dependent zinc metalloprotease FtsH [Acidobacteriota bacterium]HQQ47490.1 ATP-dependent zinc metalloprotease FtsH [Acidobacteriota bacterium]
MNQQFRSVALILLVFVIFFISFGLFKKAFEKETALSFTEFSKMVDAGEIKSATIKGTAISGELAKPGKEGATRYSVTLPPDLQNFTPTLVQKGVAVDASESSSGQYLVYFLYLLPVILMVVFWFVFIRQMQSGGNKAMSFGKSKARMITSSKNRVTFDDVAGMDEVEEEVQEIIDFLKDPKRFEALGGKIPKGVLLMGPPGTGKTLLAKAIAGEANVPFFSISGSEFVELFVGVGASRVRDMFDQAKKNSPCIVFVDEIDAVGRHRGAGVSGGGHEEREQTLNQLLVEMDGFESNQGVIMMAATNRPDVLDPALLRPGRFDRRIVIPRPDLRGREAILKVHLRNIKISDNVDVSIIARGTPGFSGADLANLANEAALRAARKDKQSVEMVDFDYAKDKVLLGMERRSMILSEDDKKVVAYHEAGHAIVALNIPEADPVHKVSIVPRGMALGVTQQLPIDDRYNYSKAYLDAELAVLLGGRTAEEIFLKNITTGAGNDLERATEIARNMVTQWGMSEKIGLLSLKGDKTPFLNLWEGSSKGVYSERTAEEIDAEIKKMISVAHEKAEKILTENSETMGKLVAALLEKEVLDKDELEEITGRKLPGMSSFHDSRENAAESN